MFCVLCCSSLVSKDAVSDGSFGALQSSSGFQQNWCGVSGQMSMADIVKMGRPQGRASSKPTATTDKLFADQNPSLSNANPTFDQRFPALPDHVPQVMNSSHPSANSHQTHENVWFQDELPSRSQFIAPEPSGDQLLSVASSESSVLVADAVNLHEKSHTEDDTSTVMQTVIPSERHLEVLQDNSHFSDGLLQSSSTYQSQIHSNDDES